MSYPISNISFKWKLDDSTHFPVLNMKPEPPVAYLNLDKSGSKGETAGLAQSKGNKICFSAPWWVSN